MAQARYRHGMSIVPKETADYCVWWLGNEIILLIIDYDFIQFGLFQNLYNTLNIHLIGNKCFVVDILQWAKYNKRRFHFLHISFFRRTINLGSEAKPCPGRIGCLDDQIKLMNVFTVYIHYCRTWHCMLGHICHSNGLQVCHPDTDTYTLPCLFSTHHQPLYWLELQTKVREDFTNIGNSLLLHY